MIENYNEWIADILINEFSFLNKNCISLDLLPNRMYETYDIDSNNYTNPTNDEDAFILKEPNEIKINRVFKPANPIIIRYSIPINIEFYKDFQPLFVSIVLSALNKIEELTGKSHKDIVRGAAYLTFNRPGYNKTNFIRQLENGNYEVRAFSNFIKE